MTKENRTPEAGNEEELHSGPPGDPAGNNNQKRKVTTAVSWVVTGLLLALIAAVGFYAASRKPPAPVPPPTKLANVQVAAVRTRPYREVLVLPALLEADRSADVSPEFGGKLARWLAEEGEEVRQGQIVAELDTEALEASLGELQARRRSAETTITQARVASEGARVGVESAHKEAQLRELAVQGALSDLELARTEHDRVDLLFKVGVVDRATLDAARNALTQARVRLDQAKEALTAADLGIRAAEVRVAEAHAGLARAQAGLGELDAAVDALKVQLGKARLAAPIHGRLEAHLSHPGEFVAAGSPVARIYDLRTLRAAVQVPDRYIAFLNPANPAVGEYVRRTRPGAVPGVTATIEVPGLPELTGAEKPGLKLRAQIALISQAADPQSNTFRTELRVSNPGTALKQGVIARARIEYLTYPEAIVIPMRAVQTTDAGPRVMVAVRKGGADLAQVRDIVPASVSEDEILVLQGLRSGDRLIVAGWKGLVSGEQVNVVVENGASMATGGEEDVQAGSPSEDRGPR